MTDRNAPLPLAGAVQDGLDPRGELLPRLGGCGLVAGLPFGADPDMEVIGLPVVDTGPAGGSLGLIHDRIVGPNKCVDKNYWRVFNVNTLTTEANMEKVKITLSEPLFVTDKPVRSDSDAFALFAIGDWTVYSGPKTGQGVSEEQLAAFVTHSANAYPKLVEALRDARTGMLRTLNPVGGDAKCAEVLRIEALLRDLGEAV